MDYYEEIKNVIEEKENNELRIEDMLHDLIIINIDEEEKLSEKALKNIY